MKAVSQSSIRSLIVAGGVAIAVIAPTAFAQEATQFDFHAQPSTQTFAAVRAEVLQARVRGTLSDGGEATQFALSSQPSTVTRAQVIAKALAARELGLLGHGEISPAIATPAQQRQIAAAGLRAIEHEGVSQR